VFDDGEFNTSVVRNHLHSFDLSAPAFKLGVRTLTVLANFIGVGGAALLGFMKRHETAKTLLMTMMCAAFVRHLTGTTFNF
jgi:hypothetical protein